MTPTDGRADTAAIAAALAAMAPEDKAVHTYELYEPGFLIAPDSTHLNFGYWSGPDTTLREAGDALADRLAETAGLADGQHVLDAGVGFGAPTLRWAAAHRFARLAGVGLTTSHLDWARERARERGLDDRLDLHEASATDIAEMFAPGTFDRVLSLEGAYHFDTREDFFRAARTVLRPDGVLALADIVPLHPDTSPDTLRRSLFSGMQRTANWYDLDGYRERLTAAGFTDVTTTSIRDRVFLPYLHNLQRTAHDPDFARRVGQDFAALVRDHVDNTDLLSDQIGGLDYVLVRATRTR